MEEKTLESYWWSLIRDTLLSQDISFISSAGRIFTRNTHLVVPGSVWEKGLSLTVNDLGYQGLKGKMNQLKRVYYNPEGIQAAREKLEDRIQKKRDFTSVVVPTFGSKKDSRSQGYCMNSIVVTYIPKDPRGETKLYVDIFYRITELIQKFGADLLFLHSIVIPEIIPTDLGPITEVRFSFANCYVSPLFIPVIYYFVDPTTLLEVLEERWGTGHQTFKSCFRAVILPFFHKNPDHYKYRTRRLMHLLSLDHLKEGRINKNKLLAWLKNHPDLAKYAQKFSVERGDIDE
jgi:hypothetical protein